MYLEATTRPTSTLRVNARLINASTILHYSADELELALNREQEENALFEVKEQPVCYLCGIPLQRQGCPQCGQGDHTSEMIMIREAQQRDEQAWRFNDNADGSMGDDEDDPLTCIASSETLADTLLHQLELLIIPEDFAIAEMLVGNLNEHGYLEADTAEIAHELQVNQERVEFVLDQLQTLEPAGIGARNTRECLLLQLAALGERPPLVETLIKHHLERLGNHRLHDLARELKVPEQAIQQAKSYIRNTLHPFPAYLYRSELPATRHVEHAPYIRPDVIIRRSETTFVIELIEEKRYTFQVRNDLYPKPLHRYNNIQQRMNYQHTDYLNTYASRAQNFIECVQRRWQTLKEVMERIVEQQRAFLLHGPRFLNPLTRAEIARQLGLDESTVSRAIAGKYALLPNGRLISIAEFFNNSLGPKDLLREIIASKSAAHRFNDDELAAMLTARGITIARRTVTKYRKEMGIDSSHTRT